MRPKRVEHDDDLEQVKQAGEAMLMMIPRALWEVLLLQAEHDHITPGAVLDRAVRGYLEREGDPRALEYLKSVSRE